MDSCLQLASKSKASCQTLFNIFMPVKSQGRLLGVVGRQGNPAVVPEARKACPVGVKSDTRCVCVLNTHSL